jgi:REP element-mobilizing transposase RayT
VRRRRSTRLAGYDYTQEGAYFVTICAFQRACIFGQIVGDGMLPNRYGRIVDVSWQDIPEHHPQVVLDEFVVMPNHVHGVLYLLSDEPAQVSPGQPKGPSRGSLGAVVGSFKSAVTRRINRVRGSQSVPVWQRNYHDRIIRDEEELFRIFDARKKYTTCAW